VVTYNDKTFEIKLAKFLNGDKMNELLVNR